MEQDLRLMLGDRAEHLRAEKERRTRTLRTARWRRRFVVATGMVGVAAIVVGGMAMADSWRGGVTEVDPVAPPIESPGDDEEPETDVLIAEARDGSWAIYAGLSDDGETMCLSLEGIACTVTDLQEGFVVLTSYDGMEQEGFLYGTVHQDVASLELVRGDGGVVHVVPLRTREFPKKLGVEHLRFYVKSLRGQGMGTVLARDSEGNQLQATDISWGNL